MKIKVSILVPVYKVPEIYLRKCIESLINQTLKDIEIILVDDGSEDICSEIIDEYASKYNNIIAIHKENGGLSSARNKAFDRATGEYITFVDGDDFIDEKMCEETYEYAQKENVELVFWDQVTEYKNSSKIVNTNDFDYKIYNKKECRDLQDRVLDFNGKIAQAFSKLIRREILVKNNIRHHENLKQGAEGIVFNIEMFEHINSAYYIQKPYYHYTYNENSISHSFNKNNYDLVIKCFEYLENYSLNCSNNSKLIDKLYTRVIYAIITSAVSGYFSPSNKQSYRNKVKGYTDFLNNNLIRTSLKRGNKKELSISRRIAIFCIEQRLFLILYIMAKIRNIELKNK